jgi:hypothetical protein
MVDSSLSEEDKDFLRQRLGRHERLEKIGQIVDVITAMSKLASDPIAESKDILFGSSEFMRDFVVEVVKAFQQEKSGKSITEFFNERYGSKAATIAKPVDAIQEAIRGFGQARQEVKPQTLIKIPEPVKQAVVAQTAEVRQPIAQPPVKSLSKEERVETLAVSMSETQGTPVDIIKKTEMDVIGRVMKIADQNQSTGLSDVDVYKACMSITSDEKSGAKFILEALGDAYRNELLKRATEASRQPAV